MTPGLKIDAIDLRILEILQKEGRITKLALAARVNLSPTPCWQRLQRLEKAGVIKGYQAEIALSRLVSTTTIFMEVTLGAHKQRDFHVFESFIGEAGEIVECWAVGGGVDYLLKIVVRDVDAYQRMVDRLLEAEIGIDRYFTYVVTKRVKQNKYPSLDVVVPLLNDE